MTRYAAVTAIIVLAGAFAHAAEMPTLTIELPEGLKVQSAAAAASALKLQTTGAVQGRKVVFANLLPDTPYDVRLVLSDGTVLQGVDMSWYSLEPRKSAEPMDEDDRKQIDDLFFGHKGFENKRNMLIIQGDGERAVILAELIRDVAFHSDKGGEIIWRVELWYFRNQHGGWEKVQQQNKVLRRERFTSRAQFDAVAGKLRWLAQLGGIKLARGENRTITLDLTKKEDSPVRKKAEQ